MDLMILGAMSWWSLMLGVFFAIICVVMIIVVLLQKGKGGGLSAAFGGAGGQSAFGSKTGDVFTWATIVIAGLFLVLAMVCTMTFKPSADLDDLGGAGAGITSPVDGGQGRAPIEAVDGVGGGEASDGAAGGAEGSGVESGSLPGAEGSGTSESGDSETGVDAEEASK